MKQSGVFVTEQERQSLDTARRASGMFLSSGAPIGNPGEEADRLIRKYGMPEGTGIQSDTGEFVVPDDWTAPESAASPATLLPEPAVARDGGPAFPVIGFPLPDGGELSSPGLTVRDWFAARLMQAAFAGQGARMVADRDERYDETNWAEVVAANAYEMADAMLAARERGER